MAQPTFAAIDIGSTKICTVVAELTASQEIRILGVGVGPSQGITRGMVDNIHAAMEAISSSLQRAERAAGVRILSAHVGFTGPHISSMGSRGIVAITDPRLPIAESDMDRALESARIVNIPNNREVVHVVPRYYVVDGQDYVANALGMFGSRLDMETHVVTAGSSAIQNILRCVEGAGVHVDSLIVGPLAAAEAAAEREELQHGAVLIDIGGGATDITVFVRGTPVHTAVLPVGGAQMTGDLVVALRVPQPAAEQAKIAHGHALASLVDESDTITIDAFGAEGRKEIPKRFLAEVLQARCEELLEMVRAEVRRGAQTELLAAGAVLTGGGASIRGLDLLAEEVLELPARIGRPRHLAGLSDLLNDPAYSMSVGLLRWALREQEIMLRPAPRRRRGIGGLFRKVAQLMRVVLPQ